MKNSIGSRKGALSRSSALLLSLIALLGFASLSLVSYAVISPPKAQADSATPAGNVRSPTRNDLASFVANRSAGGVLLHWRTGFEALNLGFNIYREESGRRARINPQMIAGSALMSRATLSAGRSYAWLDNNNSGDDVRYWLEEVDLDGQREWHGPVALTTASATDDADRSREQSLILSRVDTGNASDRTSSSVGTSSMGAASERMALASRPTEAGLRRQATATARGSVKLGVKREGWYSVAQAELVHAGLDAGLDPRLLQLFVDGRQQPIIVRGEADGRFDAGDTVEFYGLGVDSQATDTRIYWVAAGAEPGMRIEEVKGRKGKAAAQSFPYTVERKDRTIYFSSLANREAENFFGPVISTEPLTETIALRAIDRAAGTAAQLEVILQGVTGVQHRVRVFFNDADLGEIGFYDREHASAKLSIPVASLRDQENAVRLIAEGGESDVSLLDRIRLTYRRGYSAENDSLRFTAKGKSRLTVDGFTSSQVRVLDVTDPDSVAAIKAQVVEQAGGYAVTFVTTGQGERTLLAVAESRYERPATIAADSPSNLRQSDRGADLVIIAHKSLVESIPPLTALRQSQGLEVAVIDVEDVYDEFSYGQKGPQAIKDFLSYARENWRPSPHFVLLVGDASLDPKNYLGLGDFDFVPTKIIDTVVLETASDDWLADFDGDGLENMAMGRLPVRTLEEANHLIGKIIGYERSGASDEVLLVNDVSDDYDFQSINPQLRRLIPGGLRIQEILRGGADGAATKTALIDSLNRGPKVVNYFGHGSVDEWNGDLLNSSDARGLTNGDHLALVMTITCLNGYFQDPAVESLSESLVKAEGGGAVAVWASSGLCDAASQGVISIEMFRLLLGGPVTLGEAAMRAKAATVERDTRQTYILFGDPTSRLR